MKMTWPIFFQNSIRRRPSTLELSVNSNKRTAYYLSPPRSISESLAMPTFIMREHPHNGVNSQTPCCFGIICASQKKCRRWQKPGLNELPATPVNTPSSPKRLMTHPCHFAETRQPIHG